MAEVHPHVCGDFLHFTSVVWPCAGSPPRMWGLQKMALRSSPTLRFTPTYVGTSLFVSAQIFDNRFTPTYVGTSFPSEAACQTKAVHPHVCGDFDLIGLTYPRLNGSPPRMWGLRVSRLRTWRHVRFTPTYVGTSRHYAVQAERGEVHPHVCGDFSLIVDVFCCSFGSPPRMWGLQVRPPVSCHRFRFTPTYVGTSPERKLLIHEIAVHPHVCGDFTTVA